MATAQHPQDYETVAHKRGHKTTPGDIHVRDDGAGIYLQHWNANKLGSEPTQAELDAVTPQDRTQHAAALKIPPLEQAMLYTMNWLVHGGFPDAEQWAELSEAYATALELVKSGVPPQ